MATKTNELPLAQGVSLTDNFLVDTPAGTKILPVGCLPQALTADKLLMPGNNMSIAEYYRQYSNRNLLDNAYWAERAAIINQRGKTEYTGRGYTIDRMYSESETGVLKIEDGYIEFRSGVFVQRTDMPYPAGTTLTLSVLTAGGNLFSGTGTLNSVDHGELIKFSVGVGASVVLHYFQNNPSAKQNIRIQVGDTPLKLAAAKLEFGAVQTLAHKEGEKWVRNEGRPNSALELAKCQKYYCTSYIGVSPGTPKAYTNEYVMIPVSASASSRTTLSSIEFPVRMRTTPTVTFYAPDTGNIGHATCVQGGDEVRIASIIAGPDRVNITAPDNDLVAAKEYYLHYTASADL